MPIKHYGRATAIVGQFCMDSADDREADMRALSSLDHTAAHIAETQEVPLPQTRRCFLVLPAGLPGCLPLPDASGQNTPL